MGRPGRSAAERVEIPPAMRSRQQGERSFKPGRLPSDHENVEDPHDPSESCAPLRVAVCVITYRRPASLVRLLGALSALRFESLRPELRIFVVDNDPAETARECVESVGTGGRFPVVYRSEKRRGIPQARNAALAAAMGWAEWIAFVDDDDVPDPDWLQALIRAQRESGADAVSGPCPPVFEARPPEWIAAGGFFESPRHPTGARRHVAFTGNVLIRVAALSAMPELFDESLAQCGGEDSEFFQRFAWAGNAIVWCEEARVRVHVPRSRMRMSWLLSRAYRTGTTEAYIARKRHAAGRTGLALLTHGVYCVGKALLLLSLAFVRGPAAAARAVHLGCYGAGRIAGAFGVRYREYGRPDAA